MYKMNLLSHFFLFRNKKVSIAKFMFATLLHKSNAANISSLIQPKFAVSLLNLPNIKFVDGSWHLHKVRNSSDEYIIEHLPKAIFLDIDKICDKTTDLPHMLPTEEVFSETMTNLGISSEDHIVVYVKPGSFSGPRVWWMFKAFGHENVSLINGGIEGWKLAGNHTFCSTLLCILYTY